MSTEKLLFVLCGKVKGYGLPPVRIGIRTGKRDFQLLVPLVQKSSFHHPLTRLGWDSKDLARSRYPEPPRYRAQDCFDRRTSTRDDPKALTGACQRRQMGIQRKAEIVARPKLQHTGFAVDGEMNRSVLVYAVVFHVTCNRAPIEGNASGGPEG